MAEKYLREVLTSPHGLLSALRDRFPSFGDEELWVDVLGGDADLHTVMREFSSYFEAPAAEPSQLAGLASLISQCVAVPDELENAVGTCFLEHLRQTDRCGTLWKCLSPDVKAYVRAH